MKQLKYFSMFSGVGGFELGITKAYENQFGASKALHATDDKPDSNGRVGREQEQRSICVGYSEIDKYAIQTYQKHFKEHRNYGDATKINERQLPDFDLLVGGFPCQAFSVAGKRHGFNDTRGTLFFDIARILAHKRPRHLVLENVKGLLSHDSGKTFQTILGVLTDLGYVVEWQVLNAKDFGVPQNRERVFIVGHLGNECGHQVFPITGSSQQIASVAGYISEEVWPRRHEQIRRVYNDDGAMPTIPTGQGGGVMTKVAIKSTAIRTRTYANQPGQLETRTDNVSNAVDSVPKDYLATDGLRIRRLTPLECERLMSWPDNWTIGSDTQRYKQCGNGVVSNCVQAIMEKLIGHEATVDNKRRILDE